MVEAASNLPDITIKICGPRGFCAGVDRAIQIVERALDKYGAPVYVRHEIVHNRFVVDSLKAKGAVFVDELDQIPETRQPVIFSAHGVPKSVPNAARLRNMHYVDATCPLVSKVHKEAMRLYANGRGILLIGHAGHPEVIGTIGQLPDGAVTLIETLADARSVQPAQPEALSFITQTTLSVDDTREIVDVLKTRFPLIEGPKHEDICYATTNRQLAVKEVACQVDGFIVVGAPNSSNSKRLCEVAASAGCRPAIMVQHSAEIDWNHFAACKSIGLSAGASAPEWLVGGVIESAREHYDITVQEVELTREFVQFNLPMSLRSA